MHYRPDVASAFSRVVIITQEVNYGWILRNIHINGASFFFICIYTHVGRGLYYGSYNLAITWTIGVVLLLLTIMTAFIGYVLPWGQISFWGVTVITNLVRAIPYVGTSVVHWLWGGFSIGGATITRFFTFHFVLPFIVAFMSFLHLAALHTRGSRNPLGLPMSIDKVVFHPYFTLKDATGGLVYFYILIRLSLLSPNLLGDTDNYIKANPINTPLHIQPEWYFLFAYAILRRIPSKLGGVVGLIMSILILFSCPLFTSPVFKRTRNLLISKKLFWVFCLCVVGLRWLGSQPIEQPYVLLRQVVTVFYFGYFLTSPLARWVDKSLLSK